MLRPECFAVCIVLAACLVLIAVGSQLMPCSWTVHVWSDDILQPRSAISNKASAVSISALMLAGYRAGSPSILLP